VAPKGDVLSCRRHFSTVFTPTSPVRQGQLSSPVTDSAARTLAQRASPTSATAEDMATRRLLEELNVLASWRQHSGRFAAKASDSDLNRTRWCHHGSDGISGSRPLIELCRLLKDLSTGFVAPDALDAYLEEHIRSAAGSVSGRHRRRILRLCKAIYDGYQRDVDGPTQPEPDICDATQAMNQTARWDAWCDLQIFERAYTLLMTTLQSLQTRVQHDTRYSPGAGRGFAATLLPEEEQEILHAADRVMHLCSKLGLRAPARTLLLSLRSLELQPSASTLIAYLLSVAHPIPRISFNSLGIRACTTAIALWDALGHVPRFVSSSAESSELNSSVIHNLIMDLRQVSEQYGVPMSSFIATMKTGMGIVTSLSGDLHASGASGASAPLFESSWIGQQIALVRDVSPRSHKPYVYFLGKQSITTTSPITCDILSASATLLSAASTSGAHDDHSLPTMADLDPITAQSSWMAPHEMFLFTQPLTVTNVLIATAHALLTPLSYPRSNALFAHPPSDTYDGAEAEGFILWQLTRGILYASSNEQKVTIDADMMARHLELDSVAAHQTRVALDIWLHLVNLETMRRPLPHIISTYTSILQSIFASAMRLRNLELINDVLDSALSAARSNPFALEVLKSCLFSPLKSSFSSHSASGDLTLMEVLIEFPVQLMIERLGLEKAVKNQRIGVSFDHVLQHARARLWRAAVVDQLSADCDALFESKGGRVLRSLVSRFQHELSIKQRDKTQAERTIDARQAITSSDLGAILDDSNDSPSIPYQPLRSKDLPLSRVGDSARAILRQVSDFEARLASLAKQAAPSAETRGQPVPVAKSTAGGGTQESDANQTSTPGSVTTTSRFTLLEALDLSLRQTASRDYASVDSKTQYPSNLDDVRWERLLEILTEQEFAYILAQERLWAMQHHTEPTSDRLGQDYHLIMQNIVTKVLSEIVCFPGHEEEQDRPELAGKDRTSMHELENLTRARLNVRKLDSLLYQFDDLCATREEKLRSDGGNQYLRARLRAQPAFSRTTQISDKTPVSPQSGSDNESTTLMKELEEEDIVEERGGVATETIGIHLERDLALVRQVLKESLRELRTPGQIGLSGQTQGLETSTSVGGRAKDTARSGSVSMIPNALVEAMRRPKAPISSALDIGYFAKSTLTKFHRLTQVRVCVSRLAHARLRCDPIDLCAWLLRAISLLRPFTKQLGEIGYPFNIPDALGLHFKELDIEMHNCLEFLLKHPHPSVCEVGVQFLLLELKLFHPAHGVATHSGIVNIVRDIQYASDQVASAFLYRLHTLPAGRSLDAQPNPISPKGFLPLSPEGVVPAFALMLILGQLRSGHGASVGEEHLAAEIESIPFDVLKQFLYNNPDKAPKMPGVTASITATALNPATATGSLSSSISRAWASVAKFGPQTRPPSLKSPSPPNPSEPGIRSSILGLFSTTFGASQSHSTSVLPTNISMYLRLCARTPLYPHAPDTILDAFVAALTNALDAALASLPDPTVTWAPLDVESLVKSGIEEADTIEDQSFRRLLERIEKGQSAEDRQKALQELPKGLQRLADMHPRTLMELTSNEAKRLQQAIEQLVAASEESSRSRRICLYESALVLQTLATSLTQPAPSSNILGLPSVGQLASGKSARQAVRSSESTVVGSSSGVENLAQLMSLVTSELTRERQARVAWTKQVEVIQSRRGELVQRRANIVSRIRELKQSRP